MSKIKTAKNKQLRNIANWLIKKLKAEGFIIQRYDSYSTNSIYIKLDFGVSHSIRISDHKGKKHLSYRYNLLTCCPYLIATKSKKGLIKYYFPIDAREVLLQKVLFDRRKRLETYGENSYKNQMEQYRLLGQTKRGFWEHSKIV